MKIKTGSAAIFWVLRYLVIGLQSCKLLPVFPGEGDNQNFVVFGDRWSN